METRRQVQERNGYRTSLVIGHLFFLWPLFIISLLLLMEGGSWMTNLNALKYAPHLRTISEGFMAVYLLFYYGDMVKGALMLDKTRQIELVNLTNQLWMDRERSR